MQGANRIAVIGAGISGLSAAWLLGQKYEVTLFEAGDYLGGHTNTVDVTLDGVSHPVDTGFLVYNTTTYPNLTAMFASKSRSSNGRAAACRPFSARSAIWFAPISCA
jgi:uncharacterized protein